MNTDLISKVIYKQAKGQPGEVLVMFDGELESLGMMTKNDAIALAKKSNVLPETIYHH